MEFFQWRQVIAMLFANAFLLMLGSLANAQPYSAEEMLSDCHSIETSAKKSSSAKEVELDNTFQTGSCWGAFLSLQQLITLKKGNANNPMFDVCAPEEATLVQIIQVFDAYAEGHPKEQKEPFTIVALNALHGAFPCMEQKGRRKRLGR
ncbi:MAG: Rap1a/Tai family immunity protein [Rhodomicrobium sp.]